MKPLLQIPRLILFIFLFFFLLFSAHSQCINWAASGTGDTNGGFPAGVAVDINGNSYFTGGFFKQIIFGGTTLSADTGNGSQQGLFLTKYNPSGILQWSKVIAVGVDPFAFQAITSDATSLFVYGGAQSMKVGNDSSATAIIYLIKVDFDGNVVWDKLYSATGGFQNCFSSVVPDNSGGVVAGGRFRQRLTLGTSSLDAGNSNKSFLTHIDLNGTVLWAKQAAATGSTTLSSRINSVHLKTTGNIVACGLYTDSLQFDNVLVTESNPNTADKSKIWYGQFDSTGACLWLKGETTLSNSAATGFDCAYAITTDDNDKIYIAGRISDTSSVFGTTVYAPGLGDAFVAKLNANGNYLWIQRLIKSTPNGFAGLFDGLNVYANNLVEASGWIVDTCTLGNLNLYSVGSNLLTASFNKSSGAVQKAVISSGGSTITQSSAFDTSGNAFAASYFAGTFNYSNGTLTSASDSDSDPVLWKVCRAELDLSAPFEQETGSRILVFPNPASGVCNLKISQTGNHLQFSLCDMKGIVLQRKELINQPDISVFQFDVTHYLPGEYFIKIVIEKEVAVKKLVVLR